MGDVIGDVKRDLAVVAIFMVSVAVALATAAPAAALPPGVHTDPNSPASKEYAIPLGVARGGGPAGGSGSPQLFGTGITNARAATNAPGSGTSAGGATNAPSAGGGTSNPGKGSRGTHQPVVAGPSATEAAKVLPPAKLLNSGHGGSGVLWMLGVAAIVLVAGGLGGVALARRNRGTSPPAS